jgi:hypothetical protein
MPAAPAGVRICAVFIVLASHGYAQQQQQSQGTATTFAVFMTCSGLLFSYYWRGGGSSSLVDVLSLLLVGSSLTPVLGTLTRTYATNTVTSLTRLCLVVHLLAMDSSSKQKEEEEEIATVSFNAGFAATLLMASRLESPFVVFAFSLLCAAVLVLLPYNVSGESVPRWLVGLTCVVSGIWLGARWVFGLLCVLWFVGVHSARVLERDAREAVPIVGKWDLLHVEEEQEVGIELRHSPT